MSDSTMTSFLFSIFYNIAIFTVPPLLIATIVAFVIGLFQAVTQIQEQTLPQTIKIFVIGFILIAAGPLLIGPLYATSEELFTNFYKEDAGR